MYREELSKLSFWLIFIVGVFIGNILWALFYIYRLFQPLTEESMCKGVVWFFVKYGEFMSCCYIVLLFVSFPKRAIHSRSFSRMKNSLMVLKISTLASIMYLFNNFTLVGGTLSNQDKEGCMGHIYIIICKVTFVFCWIALNASCFYAFKVQKEGSTLNLSANGENTQNQVELLQIIS